MKRFFSVGARAALAVLFAALAVRLLRGQDMGLLLRRPAWILSAAAGLVAIQALCAWRLKILLRAAGTAAPYGSVFRLVGLSFFTGSVFPGLVGQDLVRGAGLRWLEAGTDLPLILVILLIDRLMGLAAVAAYACALAFVVPPGEGAAGLLLNHLRWPLAAGLVLALPLLLFFRRAAAWLEPRLPAGWRPRAGAAFRFLLSPGAALSLGKAFGVSLLSIGLLLTVQGTVGWSVQSAVQGPSSWIIHAFLATASIVVSALPLAPVGLGVGQAALSRLYGAFGLSPAAGLLVATAMQGGQVVAALALGLASAGLLAGLVRGARDSAPA